MYLYINASPYVSHHIFYSFCFPFSFFLFLSSFFGYLSFSLVKCYGQVDDVGAQQTQQLFTACISGHYELFIASVLSLVFKSQIAYCKGPPITQVANFLVTPCLSIYNAPWYTTITSAGSYMPNTNLGFNIRCSVCGVLCFHFNSKTPTHLINDKRIRLRMQVVISSSESRVTNSFQCVRHVSKSKLG